jgi:radical SAM superfamily enzyme YgiQ (UPF0313 family)
LDILLIEPPYKSLKGIGSEYGYSISTVSIAAYLRQNGIDTAVLSGNLAVGLPTEESFSFDVRKYAAGQTEYEKILADATHPIWRKLSDTIRACNPKIVGITCLTPMMDSVQKVAALAKEIDEKIIVVAGGHHPTFCPEETLGNTNIDIAVRGEGEIPLLQVIKALLSGLPGTHALKNISGIHFKQHGTIIGNPDADMIADLDSLPFPARDLVLNCDYNQYKLHYVSTARGCPYTCTFCSDKKLWRNSVRRRSLKNVIEEIIFLKNNYDIKYIDIVDGTFTFDRNYVTEFCKIIIKEKLNIKWRCSARYDNLDQDLIELMKKANCKGLYIGLESGSQKILNAVNKKTTLDDIIQKSEMIYQSGIMSVTAILLGIPQETKQTIEDTLALMKKIKTSIFDINCFVPLPGTPFYNGQKIDWKKVGFKSFDNHFTDNITREELRGYIENAYDIAQNTIKNFMIWRGLDTTPNREKSKTETAFSHPSCE